LKKIKSNLCPKCGKKADGYYCKRHRRMDRERKQNNKEMPPNQKKVIFKQLLAAANGKWDRERKQNGK